MINFLSRDLFFFFFLNWSIRRKIGWLIGKILGIFSVPWLCNPRVQYPLIVHIHIRVYVHNCFLYIDLYKMHEAVEGYWILLSLFIATSRILFPRNSIRRRLFSFFFSLHSLVLNGKKISDLTTADPSSKHRKITWNILETYWFAYSSKCVPFYVSHRVVSRVFMYIWMSYKLEIRFFLF